jgi:hydrogenase expression/formation protein HypE
MTDEFSLSCPAPIRTYANITLAHGGGGRLTNRLIDTLFGSAFKNPELDERGDGAALTLPGGKRIAFTTDSYVVRPLIFPGGDIGTLAVNGTVNDLSMCGARPMWLSCGFILEEGVAIETVEKIVESMTNSAKEAGVTIVTGDTKVVDRGKGDGIYINTAGVGIIEHDLPILPSSIQPCDVILLSGDVGRHGMAIRAVRVGLYFETTIESDCAPLWPAVSKLLDAGIEIHCLRDITRGGLATALCELSEKSGLSISITESAVPARADVRGACEILGLDPMYVANEGRFIAFVPEAQSLKALDILRSVPVSEGAVAIGQAIPGQRGLVTMQSLIGTERLIDMLSGEQLPRIC